MHNIYHIDHGVTSAFKEVQFSASQDRKIK